MRAPAAELDAPTALVVTTAAGLEREARGELSRVLPGARFRSLLLKGNLLLLTDEPEAAALAKVAAADTECVSRVIPVQRAIPVGQEPGCFPAIAAAAAEIGRIAPGDRFLVRCHRRGRHQWESRHLERGVAAEIERLSGGVGEYEAQVDWLVSIEVYQDGGFVGVNRPNAGLRKPLLRMRKYAPGERPLNRAQRKLEEAIEAFGIAIPAGARALDLGAAPGGWTAVLAKLAAEVVAVDPADLDPSVAALPNVRHLRQRAEEIEGAAALGPFDLITCDMNLEPAKAADLMCRLAGLLKPGAPAVMTVKYVTARRRAHDREARERLSDEYVDIRMRHLPHNALETTAVMKRRGAAGDECRGWK